MERAELSLRMTIVFDPAQDEPTADEARAAADEALVAAEGAAIAYLGQGTVEHSGTNVRRWASPE